MESDAMCADVAVALTVSNADDAIEFYKRVLGAEELFRVEDPEGRIAHSALRLGTSIFGINSEYPELGRLSAERLGGTPVTLTIQVPDANQVYKTAVRAGCTKVSEPTETFWGDLMASVKDPYGNVLRFAQHLEVLSPAEIVERSRTFFARAKAA
jgi:PhnB protein